MSTVQIQSRIQSSSKIEQLRNSQIHVYAIHSPCAAPYAEARAHSVLACRCSAPPGVEVSQSYREIGPMRPQGARIRVALKQPKYWCLVSKVHEMTRVRRLQELVFAGVRRIQTLHHRERRLVLCPRIAAPMNRRVGSDSGARQSGMSPCLRAEKWGNVLVSRCRHRRWLGSRFLWLGEQIRCAAVLQVNCHGSVPCRRSHSWKRCIINR